MPYLVQGNAEQIYQVFGLDYILGDNSNKDQVIKDIDRTPFLGSLKDAECHLKKWESITEEEASYYAQGNMDGRNLSQLLNIEGYSLIKNDESIEECKEHHRCLGFAYLNNQQELCGIVVLFRNDDPSQWVIGLIKNTQLLPKYRAITLLSSFDMKPFMKFKQHSFESKPVDLLKNKLMDEVNSTFVQGLLNYVVHFKTCKLNLKTERIGQLLRYIKKDQPSNLLVDPICEIEPELLFSENPTLDLIVKFNLKLSNSTLVDCLSKSSQFVKEIKAINLIDNSKVDANLLKMVIFFYEKRLLPGNRDFLHQYIFSKVNSNFLWNDEQIHLISFLITKKYDLKQFEFILSDKAYYNAVNLLKQLGLTQDIPLFLKDSDKVDALKYISSLKEENHKKLLLVFWAKGSLKIDEYKQIAEELAKYPLLAEMLLVKDRSKSISIKDLLFLALDPLKHQPLVMLYEFYDEFDQHQLKLPKLFSRDLKQLDALIVAFRALKYSGITSPKEYRLALTVNKSGELFRLFLAQIAKKNKVLASDKKELIKLLFVGDAGKQGKIIEGMLNVDKGLLESAKSLREGFFCAQKLQNLGLKNDMLVFAAQDTAKSLVFREVVLKVEAQIKAANERLNHPSPCNLDTLNMWKKNEAEYRRSIYCIAYDGLISGPINLKLKLNDAEKKILDVVDPENKSWLQKIFVVIANILITLFTLGVANDIKEQRTGNYWFFNQTPSGEDMRALGVEVNALLVSSDI